MTVDEEDDPFHFGWSDEREGRIQTPIDDCISTSPYIRKTATKFPTTREGLGVKPRGKAFESLRVDSLFENALTKLWMHL